jgi:hypothetical protein
MRLLSGAVARSISIALLAYALAASVSCARAHEGHDQPDKPAAAAGAIASPRVSAVSEAYQFVGIVEGEVLVIYLDRAGDNTPVTTATINVELDGRSFRAEPQRNGTFEVTAPLLKNPGRVEVLASIAEDGTTDLLVGALEIPAAASASSPAVEGRAPATLTLLAAGLATCLVAACLVGYRRWRGHAAVGILLLALVALARTTGVSAHEGHDHGADVKASSGNGPQRRADGTIFLPKPSQRLLEIRTAVLGLQQATKAVRLMGRVAANPNFSGVVQSTVAGRYRAPAGGVPALGAHVKAGDLLGHVTPSFASIDSSDMAQTLGDIDQKLAITRAKLARQETLLQTRVVALALVEETRLEIDGLIKRRNDLLAARIRAEELRAPVDGVIAISRAVSGQVVASSDRLFEIIDPSRVLIEALVFDQIDPDAVQEAVAIVPGGAALKLHLLGRSRALQQQYTLLQFAAGEGHGALSIGSPVTVSARSGVPVWGLFAPRAALAQAPNGQTVVFEHREPEVFLPRPVRAEPFDNETVVITAGLEPGTKIVVRNALLVNQVR